jgi:hypothetical protein
MIRVVHPGYRIRMLTFYPSRISDPGVKKAPDPDPQHCYPAVLSIRDILAWIWIRGSVPYL